MIPKFKITGLRVSAIACTKHGPRNWLDSLCRGPAVAVMSVVSKCCCCCRSVGECTNRRRTVSYKPRKRCMRVAPCEIRQTSRSRSMVAACRVTKRWLLEFGTKSCVTCALQRFTISVLDCLPFCLNQAQTDGRQNRQ